MYLNLVEGLLWVQDVVRSNRTTPTNPLRIRAAVVAGAARVQARDAICPEAICRVT